MAITMKGIIMQHLYRFGRFCAVAFAALCVSGSVTTAAPVKNQGLVLHGVPKYAPDFKHFDYANPDAPKGGSVTITWMGTFDTMNPFGQKGIAPIKLGWPGSIVFEELGVSSLDEAISAY